MTSSPWAAESEVAARVIGAPVAEVWRLFTTAEGYKVLGPSKAQVDLRLGGFIRAQYDPKRELGDEETTVNEILAYDPGRMLAIRNVKSPASFPYPKERRDLWTVVYFEAVGEHATQLRIVVLGFGDDERFAAMRRILAEGNRWTLENIGKHYEPLPRSDLMR